MNNPEIICVARPAGSVSCDYLPSDSLGIRMELVPEAESEITAKSGSITPKSGGPSSKADSISTTFRVRLTNTSEEDFLGVVHIKLMTDEAYPEDFATGRTNAGNSVTDGAIPKIFMPGYMYNTNTADKPSSGRKAFPRIKKHPDGMPESSFFMTRSDRLAEPVSLVYTSGKVRGIAAPPYLVSEGGSVKPASSEGGTLIPVSFDDGKKKLDDVRFAQYGGFTCNVNDNGRVSVGYTLGYENAPWLFVQTAKVLEREPVTEDNSIRIKAGESLTFPIIIYDYEGDDECAIYRALEDTYEHFHESPRTIPGMTEEKAAALLSSAIRDNAWLESEKMYSGFVYDREEGPRFNKIGSLSWTNGLAVAVPMLLAANRLKDDVARNQSLAFIDNVIQNSLNPDSGLLYDAVEDGKWSVHGWWYNGMHSGGHSAYLNGQAVYYILKAYISEKEDRALLHDDWIAFVKPVIRRMNEEINSDHEYPFSMSEKTGAGLEYDSMGGAWCLAATALYELVTKDETYPDKPATRDATYLDELKLSEQHYFDVFVKKCECYGGPLDTDKAVDDEGILAYIRAVRILHEITGEEYLLDHMLYALHYECSFKLCYNTPVSVKPLSTIGWSSCGGSITSTANPHIHPMSSTIIPEMRYYVAGRDDEYIRSRLEDTVLWSIQTFNTYDKEYGYGEPGWMSERFCFCQGLLTEKYPDGSPASTWFALMPWASASIIEGLCGK
ncbi:hypothetical protein SAMN02910292_02610 [Lachnospiraceae bacterium XBB2008]|nr:hypothetical protein SAMN02910292_02610 [Lachnospiraceae bacterium XBB2008]